MRTYSVHNQHGKFLTFGGLLVDYGFFGDIIYKTEHKRNLGPLRYPLYMIWAFFHIRRFKVDMQYEEGAATETATPTGHDEGGVTAEHNGGGAIYVNEGQPMQIGGGATHDLKGDLKGQVNF
ncbi:hypothetical protein Ahia01_000997900, partial [Argonauta hians]